MVVEFGDELTNGRIGERCLPATVGERVAGILLRSTGGLHHAVEGQERLNSELHVDADGPRTGSERFHVHTKPTMRSLPQGSGREDTRPQGRRWRTTDVMPTTGDMCGNHTPRLGAEPRARQRGPRDARDPRSGTTGLRRPTRYSDGALSARSSLCRLRCLGSRSLG